MRYNVVFDEYIVFESPSNLVAIQMKMKLVLNEFVIVNVTIIS